MDGDRISIPDSIEIDGDCNYPIMNRLLRGMLKPTAVKTKLKELQSRGYISISIKGGKCRKITYHYRAIDRALTDWSKNDPSKSDRSKNAEKTSLTRQKVTGRKTPQTRSNSLLDLSYRSEEDVDSLMDTEFSDAATETRKPQDSGALTEKRDYPADTQRALNGYSETGEDPSSAPRPKKVDPESSCARYEARFHQGSDRAIESEAPWMTKPHRYNPEYHPGMIKRVVKHLEGIEQPCKEGDAIRWLNKANFESTQSDMRKADAWSFWNEVIQEAEKERTIAAARPKYVALPVEIDRERAFAAARMAL